MGNSNSFEMRNKHGERHHGERHQFSSKLTNKSQNNITKLTRIRSLSEMNEYIGLKKKKIEWPGNILMKKPPKQEEEIVIIKKQIVPKSEKKRSSNPAQNSNHMLEIKQIVTRKEIRKDQRRTRKSAKTILRTLSTQVWIMLLEARRFNQDSELVSSIATQSIKPMEDTSKPSSPSQSSPNGGQKTVEL